MLIPPQWQAPSIFILATSAPSAKPLRRLQ
jgi:hypothetical protein